MAKIKKLTVEEQNQIIEENVRKINNVAERPQPKGFSIIMDSIQIVPAPYEDISFMFFATKPLGNVVQLLFKVNHIKMDAARDIVLDGDVTLGKERFNGKIHVKSHSCDNEKTYLKHKNVTYVLEPDRRTSEQWTRMLDEFDRIYTDIDLHKSNLTSTEVHDELRSYINNYSTNASTNSWIWNPDKDFNIYVEPYDDGYGVFLGKCLKYCISDEDIANRVCEILKKDVATLLMCRYPVRPKPEDECL